MDFFNIDHSEQSALDAFLTDPNLRELWFDGTDRTAMQALLKERARQTQVPTKKKEESTITLDSDNPLIRIILSRDEIKAWVELGAALQDGQPEMIEELIYESLEKENIVYGVRKQQISRIAKNPLFGKPLLVAEGRTPLEGKEGAIHFNFDTELSLKPSRKEGYSVDTEHPDFIPVVKAGTLLCTSTNMINDFTGCTVRGQKIYPQKGGVDVITAGENVHIAPDGRRWYAVADGEIIFRQGILSVYPIMRVQDVDNSTGDIHFNGSIYISGMVDEGRTIDASGNIVVGGILGSCTVKCGGHLIVGGGTKGGDHASITVGGSFRSPFIEYMNMTVQEDIFTDVILGGTISCGGGIYAFGKRGRIAGAHCTAREIIGSELGNQAGTKTTLEIYSSRSLEDALFALREERDGWKTREVGMRKIIKETSSKSRQELLLKIHTQIVDRLEEIAQEMENIQRQIDLVRGRYSFEIRAYDTLHTNVVCIIHGKILNNDKTMFNSRVYLKDELVQISPLHSSEFTF